MDLTSLPFLSPATPVATQNDTLAGSRGAHPSQNWEFLLAVLITGFSISVVIALLAKAQVVRRYLASYRHTRLTETDSVGQCEPSDLEVGFNTHGGVGTDRHCMAPPVSGEDDDGFIEDNYIPASERARAERAAENMEDTEDEMNDFEFTIA